MSNLTGERLDLGKGSIAWGPCHIGKGAVIGSNCRIGALAHVGSEAVLGDNVRIQGGAYIANECIVWDEAFIGPNATLLNDKHPPSRDASKWKPVVIEARAVIGGGATVVPGVVVGQDAVLAAGAVLTKDLPSEEVWAGNPARFLMSREQYEEARE